MSDHSYSCGSSVTCPFCGAEQSDAWEVGAYEEGDHDIYCDECEKDFTFSVSVSYNYEARTPFYEETHRKALEQYASGGGPDGYAKVMQDAGLDPWT